MRPLFIVATTADVLARCDPADLLTSQERRRADSFRFAADRDDFVAAHVLVRLCAARALGGAPGDLTLLQRCPTCDGPHGPPSLREAPDLAVSLSHTTGHVAAYAGSGPAGVDVEVVGRRSPSEVAGRVLTPRENLLVRQSADPRRAFLELWVRKEALVKAGRTTLDDLAEVDLVDSGDRLAPEYDGLRFTAWPDAGRVIAVCAAPEPAATEGSA